MNLPHSNILSVEKLTGVFKDAATSYKFYWFLSILELSEDESREEIEIKDLIIRMIVNAWYPINFFRLSFGKQDQFSKLIKDIDNILGNQNPKNRETLESNLKKGIKENPSIISRLERYVPFRFLTPWFSQHLRGVPDIKKNLLIRQFANRYFNDLNYLPLYGFVDNENIRINQLWKPYLAIHKNILKGFLFWNFTNYLQKNNPNVPNIANKIYAPKARNLSKAKKYWSTYLKSTYDIKCLYTGEVISSVNLSIDHFLPWSFLAHDQLWNLIPTQRSVNSSKSDVLPSKDYLVPFSEIQFDAFHAIADQGRLNVKDLEDYAILFKDSVHNIRGVEKAEFVKIICSTISPLMEIAENMGFQTNWRHIK